MDSQLLIDAGTLTNQGRIQQRQNADWRGTSLGPRTNTTNAAQLKAICIEQLQKYVADFQERRAKATDDVVAQFMAVRPLEWAGNPRVPRADLVVPVAAAGAEAAEGDGKLTKNQMKKLLKEQQIAAKKAEKEAAKAKAAEA